MYMAASAPVRADMAADTALLRAYVTDSVARRDDRTAVVAAACRPGADQRAASAALGALKADPPTDADAVSALLAVAAGGARVDDIAVFVLATAAWKVVTAAVNAPLPAVQDVPLRKRILVTALTSSSTLLGDIQRMFSDVADEPTNAGRRQQTVTAVTRFIKIVRFHCVNATRLAERFIEQRTAMCEADACVSSALLNLAGMLQATALQSDVLPADIAGELEKQALMPATVVTKTVLAMCENSTEVGKAIVRAFSVGDHGGVDQSKLSGRIVALAYLARMGEFANPPRPSQDALVTTPDEEMDEIGAGPKETAIIGDRLGKVESTSNTLVDLRAQERISVSSRTGDMLRLAVAPFILPLIFQLADRVYASAFRVHLRVSERTLASLVAAAVGDCAAQAVDVVSDNDTCALTVTTAVLLEHISRYNPLVAHVAAEGLLALLQHLDSATQRQLTLFYTVMAVTRLSLAADLACAEAQWVPLACQMAEYLLSVNCLHASDLFPLFPAAYLREEPRSKEGTPSIVDSMFCDVAALRVLAGLMLACGLNEPREKQPNEILQQLCVPLDKLGGFTRMSLLGNSQGGRVAEACVHLLPHVCDPRSAAGAALVCFKRPACSTSLVISALNTLNPALMPEASLRAVASEASRAMQRHGPRIYPAIVALVSRAAVCLHKSVSLSTWCSLCPPVEVAVRFAQSVSDGCTSSPQDSIISAAIMHHTAAILDVTSAIARGTNNTVTQATLPPASIPAAQAALGRVSEYVRDARIASSGSPQERLICSREAENVRNAETLRENNGLSSGLSPATGRDDAAAMAGLGPGLAALMRTVLRTAGSKGNTSLPASISGELDALMVLVPVLSAMACTSSPR
jgi:hypothetical protein